MHEIRHSAEFSEEYNKLCARASQGNSEAEYLVEIIRKATTKLGENREAGKQIPKKLWPKEYIQKYGITNLWKFNLDSNWRLSYTLTGNQIDLFLIYSKKPKQPDITMAFCM